MTTVDEARAALLARLAPVTRDEVDVPEVAAFEDAIRAEYTGWDTPTEKRLRRERDAAEAKLAALREAAIEEREATEDFIANGGQVQMERMDRSRVKLDDAIAATPAEDQS